jgi:prepilin-type N-terminal cleavage/methylation domain-containing protein|uniref:Prepilin-type N-terminal cleavage/methylation domain-containing protein n=1 Tax=Leptospirillum sp. Group II '5-way CG' TaxID=419541 RepID=B6AP98_9BACT|nr:MAG: Hypothetical protein CGL2_11226002 [Leptospirillum sp. Group II '5-way CG']
MDPLTRRVRKIGKNSGRPVLPGDAGFTMVEIMAVLLAIAILTWLLLPKIQGFLGGGKVAATEESIQGLIDTAHSFAATNGNLYTGLGAKAAQGYSASTNPDLPTNYSSSGSPNPFGGSGTLTETGPYSFSVTETLIPAGACNQLVNHFLSEGSPSCSSSTFTFEGQ